MRKFFALSLALVISLFAAMELSNIPQGLTAVKNVVSERTSHMTSCDNGIEIDGICFETLLPEQNYQLPEYGEETPIQLGVRITNNSSDAYRFDLPQFEPEIYNPNGEMMKMSWARNATSIPKDSDVPLIYPGQSLEFYFYNPKFSWYERDNLVFRGYSDYGGIWSFFKFKPGKYNIRLRYKKSHFTREVYLGLKSIKYDGFWVGEVLTSWVKLCLR